jgi:Protein of unknown function (DUF3987)
MSTPQEKIEALLAEAVHVDPRPNGLAVDNVRSESSWSEPTPLVRPIAPAPEYPIDALGSILAPAARAIAEIVQVPAALAANSVLAAAALAAQSQSNVQTLGGDRPISLYILTVSASGDRKSSADKIALTPVHAHVRRLTTTYEIKKAECDRVNAARQLQRSRAKKDAQTPEDYAAALKEIANEPAPRRPYMICTEPTAEGLLLSLRDGQFGQGIFSDEGGTFLGGHALSDEAQLRTIAMLSRAWQGDPLDRVRARDAENVTLYGRRVSMHLMAQPDVAALLLGNPLYRAQGFLARWLMAAPNSLAGTRLHDPTRPDALEDSRIRRCMSATAELLARPASEDRDLGGLDPPRLALTPEARSLLIKAYDEIEIAQVAGGALESGREWAAKAAEHACRIAGVLTLIGDADATHVSGETMHNALALVRHYLGEYLRLVGSAGVSIEIEQAQILLTWLERKRLREVTPRRVMQYGPNSIRDAGVAREALTTLEEHDWLKKGEGSIYRVHPSVGAKLPR